MRERRRFIVEEAMPLGITEQGGTVIQRDLGLYFEGKTFVLSVGTQKYLESIQKYNEKFDPENQIDENVLVMEQVDKIEEVVTSLSKMELQDVIPYLVEQKEQG